MADTIALLEKLYPILAEIAALYVFYSGKVCSNFLKYKMYIINIGTNNKKDYDLLKVD